MAVNASPIAIADAAPRPIVRKVRRHNSKPAKGSLRNGQVNSHGAPSVAASIPAVCWNADTAVSWLHFSVKHEPGLRRRIWRLGGIERRLEETRILLVASKEIGNEVQALRQHRPVDRRGSAGRVRGGVVLAEKGHEVGVRQHREYRGKARDRIGTKPQRPVTGAGRWTSGDR